ncbi:MAG: GAF domain-containing protein [Candidatus Zixiibacteriota bacterium]|nr:MAG: GAF domain-containing protein [candidate division Zixibacteria bacterium]
MYADKVRPEGNIESPDFWKKIGLLAEISARCRRDRASGTVYRDVLGLVQQLVPFDAATLFLVDSAGKRLEERATLGSRIEILENFRLKLGDGLSGWTARSRKPILLSDRTKKSNFDPEVDFACVLSYPLVRDERLIGVLNLGCRRPQGLADHHLGLLAIVADQLSISMERLIYEQIISALELELDKTKQDFDAIRCMVVPGERVVAADELASAAFHEACNLLEVIVGSAQCLRIQLKGYDQKTLTRLKRIEAAALAITEVNRRMLGIGSVMSSGRQAQETGAKSPG